MQNDASYKRLYAHAELVADLLRSCVREAWIRQLDFNTLERVPGSHVDQKLQQRHSDVIWRLLLGAQRTLGLRLSAASPDVAQGTRMIAKGCASRARREKEE